MKVPKELEAIERGYTANEDGEVFSPNNKLLSSFIVGTGEGSRLAIQAGRGRLIYVHKFVWVFFNKKMPPEKELVYHVDGNINNNAISNLQVG